MMANEPTDGGVRVADGWTYERLSEQTLLAGANGIRFGPDGALYAVSALGSRVVRLDVESGRAEVLSEQTDGTWSPDDLAFTSDGTIYLADYMMHRVTRWRRGRTDVIQEGVTLANGICTWQDRVFVNEYRHGGRLLEVFDDQRDPVVIAEGLSGPNGMTAAPDGYIYFVQVYAGEVSRVHANGGPVERVVAGLKGPTSVRIGADGKAYVSQPHGEIVAIDPISGESTVCARAPKGIDNLELDADGRIYLSYYADGAVRVISRDGTCREIVRPGLMGPFGMHAAPEGLIIADGIRLLRYADGELTVVSDRTDSGFPGFIQGVWVGGATAYVTTAAGELIAYDYEVSTVLSDGLQEPKGLAVRPTGEIVVAVAGAGVVQEFSDGRERTIAGGLGRPVGVALHGNGDVLVSDEARGELLRIRPSSAQPTVLLSDLAQPQGVSVVGDRVYVVEAGAKRVTSVGIDGSTPYVVASRLPTGAGGGSVREPLPGVLEGNPHRAPLGGPIARFADLTADDEGTLYLGGDQAGVIISLCPIP